jgi:hypothetical protein
MPSCPSRSATWRGVVPFRAKATVAAPSPGHELATGSRWYFLELAGLLADLEEKVGNEDVAAGLYHEARTTLEDSIEHIPEGELRASFLALPEVGWPRERGWLHADGESYPPAGPS